MHDWKRIDEACEVIRGASPRPIGNPKYFGGDVGWVRIVDITRSSRFLRQTEQYLSALGEACSVRVHPGDLVMSICGTLGRPIIIDMHACIHDGFVQFRNLRGVQTDYLFYVLQYSEPAFCAMGQPGTQTNLNTQLVGRHVFFCPELSQQQRIAEILSTVDEAIEQTEALIAKTQQIKAGLMHDLFTRGVTPDGKLRPPREEAPHLYKASHLGWIPNEWDANELRTCLKYISYGFTNPMPETAEGPYMVTAADISEGTIHYETCRRTSQHAYENSLTQKSRPTPGDILLTKDGTLGRIAIVDRGHVCINQSVAVLRPVDAADSPFLEALLSSPRWQHKMALDSGGSTIRHIYISVVDKMLIAWPQRAKERHEIVNCLQACTTNLIAIQEERNKFIELKQGLMHALLTGRVRVDTMPSPGQAGNTPDV